MSLQNPLFVVGTGRCGSTVFHDILSHHPELNWLSSLMDRFPHRPEVNAWGMRILAVPGIAGVVRRRIYPAEAYPFWERVAPGFASPCRDLSAADVTPLVRSAVRRGLARAAWPRRPRFAVKYVGWPRVGYIKEIFPDAKFIHVYRDGRAVANSLLAMPWFGVASGPLHWALRDLPDRYQEKWRRYDRSFVALAGIAWEMLMEAFEAALAALPPQDYLEIDYGDMCQRPGETFEAAARFAGLTWPCPPLEAVIGRSRFSNANEKWRQQLSAAQGSLLEDCLGESLTRLGYAVGPAGQAGGGPPAPKAASPIG